jgi:CBS domain-containing protein
VAQRNDRLIAVDFLTPIRIAAAARRYVRAIQREQRERGNEMKVREVMSTPPVTCSAGSSLAEAAAEMWRHDCGAVPVVNESGAAIGIITDRDIAIAVGTRECCAAEIPVSSVISGRLSYVHPGDDVDAALETMKRERIHRIPVLDDESHVVGVIAMNDLILRAAEHPADPALATPRVMEAIRNISTHLLPAEVAAKKHEGNGRSARTGANDPRRSRRQTRPLNDH